MLVFLLLMPAYGNEESCQNFFIGELLSMLYITELSSLENSSLEMLSYNGKDTNDLGRYSSCLSKEDVRYLLLYLEREPFSFRVGVCVPSDCDSESMTAFLSSNNITDVYITDNFNTEAEINTVIILSIICLLVLLCLVGTILDLRRTSTSSNKDIELQELNLTANKLDSSQLENKPREVNTEPEEIETENKNKNKNKNKNCLMEILNSFSALQTWKKLVAPPVKDNSVVLNGPRFFSMCWVILGHCFVFRIGYIKNLEDLGSIIKWKSVAIAIAGIYSVDTFFWIGGFLVGYLTLKELSQSRKFQCGLISFLRYFRILPAYVMMIGVYYSVFPFITEGPLFKDANGTFKSNCEAYWWTNLMFLNNFVPDGDGNMCFGHAWYLANDMQMFLFSLLIIYIYYRFSVYWTWAISVIYLFLEFAIRYSLAVSHNYHISVISPNNNDDVHFQHLYTKPYCRYSCYLLGLLCGFMYLRYKNQDSRDPIANCMIRCIKKAKVFWLIAGWAMFQVAVGIQSYCADDLDSLFAGFNDDTNHVLVGLNHMYVGLSYSLIFLPVLLGRIRFISGFLGFYLWSPLAKLSYSTYLAHIGVIYFIYGSDEHAMTFNNMTIFQDVLFFTILSLGLGALLYFLVESPFNELLRNRLKRRKA